MILISFVLHFTKIFLTFPAWCHYENISNEKYRISHCIFYLGPGIGPERWWYHSRANPRSEIKNTVWCFLYHNFTTVIGKNKEIPWSLFYDISCYVTVDYQKWYRYTSLLLTQCEEIRAFDVQTHVNYMYM